jgi:hypothetical protein
MCASAVASQPGHEQPPQTPPAGASGTEVSFPICAESFSRGFAREKASTNLGKEERARGARGLGHKKSQTELTPYLFTAKELDQETGLYYFGTMRGTPGSRQGWRVALETLERQARASSLALCAQV